MEDQQDVILVNLFFCDYPDKHTNQSAASQETVHVQMFVEGIEWCFLEQVVRETLIKIVLFLIPVAEQMFAVSVGY